MDYKILISIALASFISVTYASNDPAVPHPIPPAVVKPTTNAIPSRAANATDPYQYCFNNTTWVVPTQTLLAYYYTNGSVTQKSDQTVWVMSSYHQGYFFGESYTELDNDTGTLSQKHLIGSVTSQGQIYITFYSGSSPTDTDLVNGVGDLNVASSGQCTFIMQMNSGQNGVSGLAHWSYMIPVNPGDVDYENLPGTGGLSVPQFLAQFTLHVKS